MCTINYMNTERFCIIMIKRIVPTFKSGIKSNFIYNTASKEMFMRIQEIFRGDIISTLFKYFAHPVESVFAFILWTRSR